VSKTLGKDSKIMDINMIECYVQNDGSFGENPQTGGSGLFYPKGQRNLAIIYTAGLWICGKIGEEYRSAVNCYGSEFQPGAILPDGTPDETTLEKYKIYMYHKGDVIEQEALDQGCPTEVLGDQMMFCVYNDIMDHSNVWGSPPIGVEVQQTVFAFNRTGALGHTIFMRYRVINKGDNDLTEAYVGMFYDPDLGNANDDYTGCDTVLGLAIVYNGDGYDESYGVEVPALGSDFFQGPIVDAPGETATLPDGTVLVDKKVLPMTAYFAYINNAPITGMSDPHDPLGGWYFMSGLKGNGEPWQDPTAGNAATKFPFAGDPVAGTGWLFKDISAPEDVRMGNATGPFNLAVGDTQDIVVGVVVGQGTDAMSSITVMKFYDKTAQQAYDLNFELPSPPPQPQVQAAQLDEELMLTWAKGAADFSESGYDFEGYRVYQGESVAGPWTEVAVFDKANGITTIWDQQFNQAVGALLEQPVVFGKDAGLTYKFYIEKDYIRNVPLINGRHYYFSVTGYAYNPDGVPKVLENAQVAVECVPQRPVLDTKYNSGLGDEIPVTHATGPSQGNVAVIVTDPAALTGHDYTVSFYTLESGPDSGHVAWKLTDTTEGEDVMVDQTYQGLDDAFASVDGMQVKVSGPDPGVRDIVQVDAAGDVIDSNLHHSLNASDDRAAGLPSFYIHIQGESGDNWTSRLNWRGSMDTEDYEFRFVDDPATEGQVSVDAWGDAAPYVLSGYQNGPAGATVADPGAGYTMEFAETGGRLPFQAWMIDIEGNESQVFFGIIDDNGNGYWDANRDDGPWSPAGTNFERFYGTNQPYDEADILSDAGANAVDNLFWGEWWDAKHTFGRIIFSMYYDDYDADPSGNMFTEPPGAGTIVLVRTNKPNTSADTFTFSTGDYAPEKSENVAKSRLEEINVFPNPYFAHNKAESGYYEQFVTFNGLPEDNCVIRVFTLSGQLVTAINHNNGTPFERWYLQNDEDIPVASGMYIVHIETEFGAKILKVGVINREASFQHI
jgi:hypothetical protein